jgi:transposase InsO family protein
MRGEWDVSIRRACGVFEMDTSTYHYKSRRPGQAHLEQRIREICQTRVRYGYRRIHVLLRREGCRHGQNKTRRIYRELGLQLRNKTPKRRVKAKLRDDRRAATQSNETWAMDFVHDQLATGRKLRVLTIVDTFSRFSPALERDLHSVAPTLWRCSKGSAGKWDSRQRSASTKAPSLCRAIWICGLISAESRSTSRGQESRPTTPSSRPSTVVSERNVSTRTGS